MKIKILIIASITAVALYFATEYAKSVRQIITARKVAVEYLNKKYDQEFAISKAHYIRQTGTYQLEAYPRDNPDFTFSVFMGSITKDGISDQYMGTLHCLEATKIAQPYIDKITKNNYCFATSGVEKNYDKVNKYVYGLNPILSMQEIMNRFGKDICFNVYAYCALDITDQNKEQILKATYKLYRFLKDKKIGRIMIQINFYPKKLFGWMGPTTIRKRLKNNLKNSTRETYSINICPYNKYMKNINSYKDITSCVYNHKEDKNGF